jgi:CRISPR-associated protein Csx3
MVQSTDNSLQLLVTEVHSPDGSQYQCLQINIFGQLLEPVTINGLELPVDLDLNRGVVLWGSAPTWLYSYLVLRCKQAPWVGCYNVPLGRFVVVASRCDEMIVGDTFQLINKSQGFVILIAGPPDSGKSVFCHALKYTLSQIVPNKKVYLFRSQWDGEGNWYAHIQNVPLGEELRQQLKVKQTEQLVLHQANSIRNIRSEMDLVLVEFGGKPNPTDAMLVQGCTHYIIISSNSETIPPWHEFCHKQEGLKPLAVIHSVLDERLEVLQTEPYLELVAGPWIRDQTRTVPEILMGEVLKLLGVEATATKLALGTEVDRLLERGATQFRAADYIDALQSWQQALAICREIQERNRERTSLYNLGNAYYSLADYQQAIEYLQQSLIIAQEIGDRSGEVSSLSTLGKIKESLGQYQQAIDYYQQSLAITREIGDRSRAANSLSNLGSVYNSLGDYNQAIEYLQQSLTIAREIAERSGEATAMKALGNAYYSLEQYQQAIEYYQQSLEIAQTIGDRLGEESSLGNLGSTYYSLGQYQVAIQYYQQALAVTEVLEDTRNREKLLSEIAQAFTQIGEFSQALTISEGIEYEQQKAEVMSYITQALLQAENYDQALATAKVIPNEQKRLEALTKVVEVVSGLEGDRAKELLTPLRDESDKRVRQLVRQYIRVNATQIEQKKNIWKCVQTLIGHSDTVQSVAVSPDGKVIASGSLDKTIKLWNLTTGQLLATLKGHSSVVLSLAFSPDGQILASASNMAVQDGNIKLWNVGTRTLQRTLGGRLLDLRVSCLAFSPDGETLATGHVDAAIRLWHLGSGKVQRILRGHGWDVRSVTFSPDGQLLISAGVDSAIKIWNSRTGKLLHTFNRPSPSDLVGSLVSWFDSSTGSIWSVSISPDGQTIASGGSDQPIMLWNVLYV